MNDLSWTLVQWAPTTLIWTWVLTGWGLHRWLIPSLRPGPLEGGHLIRVELPTQKMVLQMSHKAVAQLGADKGKCKPGDRVVVLAFSKVTWWKPLSWFLPTRSAVMYVFDSKNEPYTLRTSAGVSKKGVLRRMRCGTDMYSPEYIAHIVEVADGSTPWSGR